MNTEEEDGIISEEVRVDFGDDNPLEKEEVLNELISKTAKNGLSKEEEEILSNILQRNKSVFGLRLGSGGIAKITCMKIWLDENKEPVKLKVPKYRTEQRKFLQEYFSKLVSLYVIKPYSQASWQAAPYLVLKDSKTKFPTAIDLHPVNPATIAEQWAMPKKEAEPRDFNESKHYASLDFCTDYWQCSLHLALMHVE